MIVALIMALGIVAACGFAMMYFSFIERPKDNDSGPSGSFGRMQAEYHPRWPPENKG